MSEVTVLDRRVVFSDQWLTVRQDHYLYRQKTWRYTLVERADTVIVLPLLAPDRLVLVRQYRYPIDRQSWGLPMGGVDAGETPEAAAERELFEETSLRAGTLELLGQFHPAPGLTAQRATVYLATVQEPPRQTDSADEIDSLAVFPLAGLAAMLQSGDLTDGFTLAALSFLQLKRGI